MPLTPIPPHLIHRGDEVERNAQRFDQLCRLAEEVALPVVKAALLREATTTGAEALVEEARTSLTGLLEEGVLAGVEDPAVIEEIRRSLEGSLPEPDQKEWQSLTCEAAQMLMSAWLEMLRTDLEMRRFVRLSDYLLPVTPRSPLQRMVALVKASAPLPPWMTEAMSSLPMTDDEIAIILSTLRAKLFSEHRLFDLPFNLVLLGSARKQWQLPPKPLQGDFVTDRARVAVASLSAPISRDDCNSLLNEVVQV
jgi:hypothetical protein